MQFPRKAFISKVSSPDSNQRFKPSGLLINRDVYQNEILKRILIPFPPNNLVDGQYVFWPDKASSHYTKKKHKCSWIPSRSHLYPKTTTLQIWDSVAQSKISSGFWVPWWIKVTAIFAGSWLLESRDVFTKLTWRSYNAPVPTSSRSCIEHPITDHLQIITYSFSTIDNLN